MPNKAKNPNLVAKYIEEIRSLTSGPGSYAYRGQEDATWGVESAASRRIRNASKPRQDRPPDLETFIRYHEDDLLAPARMDGYGTKDGRELHDLELLAELQHFGAATCLIDFTTNFLAALWFACYEFSTHEDENKDKRNGKVFVLNIDNFCRSIGEFYLENKIRPIMRMDVIESPQKPPYWYWAPHGMNTRILKQDSLFVFGKADIIGDHLEWISIDKEEKDDLLDELMKLGVSRKSLFKDLPGFASMNGPHNPIPTLNVSADGLYSAGMAAYREGNWEGAIRLYNAAEAKNFSQKAVLLRNRGFAKIRMENYDSASEDYTKSMEHEPNDFSAYYYRGIAKFFMENYKGSVEDLTIALDKNPNSAIIYYRRALTYEKIDKISEMLTDLKRAFQLAERDENNRLIQIVQEKLSEYEEPPSEDIPF